MKISTGSHAQCMEKNQVGYKEIIVKIETRSKKIKYIVLYVCSSLGLIFQEKTYICERKLSVWLEKKYMHPRPLVQQCQKR